MSHDRGWADGPAARERLKSRTQSLSVYENVRRDILAGSVRPGAKLRILELCAMHGVSNGAVREALSKLTSDGFVVAEPQKGFRVAPISREALADLTLARVEIESVCLKLALRAGDVDWEGGVVASFHRLSNIPERDPDSVNGLNEKWAAVHAEFHQALVAACPNRTMLKLRASLYEQSERYRRLSLPKRADDRDVLREHEKLMKAAIARDAQVVDLMREHLTLTMEMVLQTLDAQRDGATILPPSIGRSGLSNRKAHIR